MTVKQKEKPEVVKKAKSLLTTVADAGGHTQDERLYNEIMDAVLDHRLSPGVKLKEDELADIFSVSRTVVRRALLKLSHDRIVDIQPNRGATIIQPDVDKAREILGVRRLIERELVKEATKAATKPAIARLRACVDGERDELGKHHIGSGLRLSGDFHIQLALLSNNATLIAYLKELVPQTSLIIAMYQVPNHSLCSHDEHFELINAVESGDVDAAQSLMVQHLHNIEAKLDLGTERSVGDLYAAFAHVK